MEVKDLISMKTLFNWNGYQTLSKILSQLEASLWMQNSLTTRRRMTPIGSVPPAQSPSSRAIALALVERQCLSVLTLLFLEVHGASARDLQTFNPWLALNLVSPVSSRTNQCPIRIYPQNQRICRIPSTRYTQLLWNGPEEEEKKKKKKLTPTLPNCISDHDDSLQQQQQPGVAVGKCLHCEIAKTPQWRAGPMGPKTLCNACGVRYRSGRLFPEYRPGGSPAFVASPIPTRRSWE